MAKGLCLGKQILQLELWARFEPTTYSFVSQCSNCCTIIKRTKIVKDISQLFFNFYVVYYHGAPSHWMQHLDSKLEEPIGFLSVPKSIDYILRGHQDTALSISLGTYRFKFLTTFCRIHKVLDHNKQLYFYLLFQVRCQEFSN